jgi:hypothetical protein
VVTRVFVLLPFLVAFELLDNLENCFCTLAFHGCLIKLNILTQVRSGQTSQRQCISGKQEFFAVFAKLTLQELHHGWPVYLAQSGVVISPA